MQIYKHTNKHTYRKKRGWCGFMLVKEENWEENGEDDFMVYLKKKHKTENTIRAYIETVRQFYGRYPVMTEQELHLYKLFLVEHYKPRTINLRICAINSYLEYRGEWEFKLSMVKIQQKPYLERVISEADYEYLKTCLKRDGEWLYYFLIRYMAATGMRVSEVVKVTVEDVKAGQKDIYSKDNKVRRVYIPESLKKDTLTWMKREKKDSGWLFVNDKGDVVTAAAIRSRLKKMAVVYGISELVMYPHSFRHRFAKSFMEYCGDISMLSDLLGHESMETTRIYLRRTSAEQQQVVNRIVDW